MHVAWLANDAKFDVFTSYKSWTGLIISFYAGEQEWKLHGHVTAKPEELQEEMRSGPSNRYPFYSFTANITRRPIFYVLNIGFIVVRYNIDMKHNNTAWLSMLPR